jgi:hypothetical protein
MLKRGTCRLHSLLCKSQLIDDPERLLNEPSLAESLQSGMSGGLKALPDIPKCTDHGRSKLDSGLRVDTLVGIRVLD